MCDYSLEMEKSRPAVQGERLVTHKFMRGTRGFLAADDDSIPSERTAVCLLPGTELAFDSPVVTESWFEHRKVGHAVARFTQINKDVPHTHHDALEFPGQLGVDPVLVTYLAEGQTVTVLQLPHEALPDGDIVHPEPGRVKEADPVA